MDKRVLLTLAIVFVVNMAVKGGTSQKTVFDCLTDLSWDTRNCYKQAYGFRNTFGTRFSSLKQRFVPDELARSHSTLSNKKQAKLCIKSLKNFVKPLESVLESERNSHHDCPNGNNNLNETINGLLTVLKESISLVGVYVQRSQIMTHNNLTNLHVHPVNMTRMTSLVIKTMTSLPSKARAVRVRNFVLLDYLNKLSRDISDSDNCFNTKLNTPVIDQCTAT